MSVLEVTVSVVDRLSCQSLFAPPRARRRPSSRVPISLALLATVLLLALALAPDATTRAQSPSARWQPLAGDRPLAGHAAAHDPAARRMLVHGGERGFYEAPQAYRQLDLTTPGAAWSTLAVSGTVPRARLDDRGLPGSRLVVDPDERVALAVCDCRDARTYLLDLASGVWSVAPGDQPQNEALATWFHVLRYDAPRDRALLIGGDIEGDNRLSSEVWAYDLSLAREGWTQLPSAPFTLLHQAAALDLTSGRLVLFGGRDVDGEATDVLWSVDLSAVDQPDAWQQITPNDGPWPEPRLDASLTYTSDAGTALLYGGYTPAGEYGDVWQLTWPAGGDSMSPRWTRLSAGASGEGPGARSGHSAIWDPVAERVVIYGGIRGLRFLSDAWALSLGSGPSPTPTVPVTPTAPVTPSPTPDAPPGPMPIYLPAGYTGR